MEFRICFFLLIVISLNSFSQTDSTKTDTTTTTRDTTKVSDSSKLEEVKSKLDELYNLVKLNSIRDSSQQTGVVRMNTRLVSVHSMANGNITGRKILIDSISLLINDGFVIEIIAYSDKNRFTNTLAPIAITPTRLNRGARMDWLFGMDNTKEKILLQEILYFQAYNSYLPNDAFVWLTQNKPAAILDKGVGLSTILDLRIYTDGLALFGNEPNGVFQTDARLKHYLTRMNVWNRGIIPFRYFKFKLNLARLDRRNNFEDSARFSRTGLLQKSWMNAEVAFALTTIWAQKKSLSNWYIEIGGGINMSELAKSKDTITITTPNLFTEWGVNIKGSDNSGLDLYGRASVEYSPQTDFNTHTSATDSINFANAIGFIRFGAEAFWNPLGDRAGRLFARCNYTFATRSSEKKNHFFQLQFGYSIILSNLTSRN
jgi:hypothetical protein